MVNWGLCVMVAGAVGVGATTAPGFPVRAGPDLNVTWGDNNVGTPGELLPIKDVASPPSQISAPVWTTSGHALLMLVDSSVPASGNTTRIQMLHWLVTNVTRPSSDTQTLKITSAKSDALAPYKAPSPPLNDTAHNYTLLLFQQPENFTVPAMWKDRIEKRLGWDAAAFANSTRLGAALAAEWVRVENRTGAEGANATASATASATATETVKPSDYAGAAGALQAQAWMGSAVVAGLMAVLL